MVPVVGASANNSAILVLGDSLSAAHNIAASEGWVARLSGRLAPRPVINASISGETTQSGRNRLPALLAEHRPAIVIIELGANDGLRGLPLSEIHSNLAAMIKTSQKAGARVLLLGIELPVNYGPRYRDDLRQIYADLAKQFGARLVPFLLEGVALKSELMQADGMHPNARGEPVVFDNVWSQLGPMLQAKRGVGSRE